MYILLKIIWIVNSLYITGLRSCNISLTSNGSFFELGTTNVTLSCRVCNISSGITFYHNTEYVGNYFNRISLTNNTLYSANGHKNDNGTGEMNLIILKFGTSFSGNYTCSNGGSYHSSIALSHKVSVGSVSLTPALTVISVLPNVALSYIKCVSSEGRPAPIITWYLDNKTPSDYSDDVNLTGNSSSSTVADVTTSSLKLTPTINDHDARIYCNVSNGYGQIMSIYTLKIDVLIYPTKPTIKHNTVLVPSNISVMQNSTITMECNSSGNPIPSISWTLFNGSIVSGSAITLKIDTSHNQNQIACSAASFLDPTNEPRITAGNTTVLTVNILYPPSSPSCQIGTFMIQSNIIRAVGNEPFTMTCSSRSNPHPSRYTWTLPNGQRQYQAILNIASVQMKNDGQYTLEVFNEMNLTFAYEIVQGNVTATYAFEILYPITNMYIYYRGKTDQHISSPTFNVVRGFDVRLGCNAISKPAASYAWASNGVIFANGSNLNTSFDKDIVIECIASNIIDPTGKETRKTSSSTNVSASVLFAPENFVFNWKTCGRDSTTNHIKVIEDNSVSGTCTSQSKPGSRYSWIPDISEIRDSFFISHVSRKNNGNYTCKAYNEMNTTFSGIINGTNLSSFRLDVLVPAAALFIDNLTVLLNTTLLVTCPYTPGNPQETRFTWFHANTSRIVPFQNLSLSRVQLTDEGYYKCRVNNTMEPTGCVKEEAYDETTFYLDVQYPASLRRFYVDGLKFTSSITVNESQTVTLICEAESDPVAKLELVNITKGYERLLVVAHNNTLSTRVVNARCEFDMGIYQCKGKNIYNAVQQVSELEIRIACSPRPSPFAPLIATTYRRRNSSAILTFTIVAYPPPNDASAYVWLKLVGGKWITLHNDSRFHIRISNDSLQTNLSISQLQIDDFTNYLVRVNNNFGSTEETFVIRANEQPSVPQQLLVVDAMVNESSVTVQWTPGFNGGEDQWFVIGYKKAADESWTYINVSSTVSQLSIGELVAGTKYDVKLYAENIIGKSDETTVLSVKTKSVISDKRSSSSVGAAAGGAVGGTLLAVILVILWKNRNALKRKPGEGAHYDDLFNRQANGPAANTSSEYEAYKVESQHTNQYETLAETSFHEYSVLSPGGKQDYSVRNRVTQVTESDRAIVNQENAYVNLSFSET